MTYLALVHSSKPPQSLEFVCTAVWCTGTHCKILAIIGEGGLVSGGGEPGDVDDTMIDDEDFATGMQ